MNITSRLHSKPGSFLSRLLTTGLSVWLLGVAFSPALAATTPSPIVDQAPLIIQKPLPPNITLMLDDSGSMAWDVMPDWGSLSSTIADALVNSDVNGVYFNPTVTYTPPLKADGSSYSNTAFDSALINGFDPSSTKVDLSTYDGSSDNSRSGQSRSDIAYSVGAGSGSYNASTCGGYDGTSQRYPAYCYASNNNGSSDFKYNGNYYYYRCSSHQDKYYSGKCYPYSFFTYTKRDSSGNYTRYYVAKTAGDCAAASLSATVCDESAVTRQNVANWFSYYHTRILMAKSGLMNAFSGIDSTYRIGFGSIDGGGSGNKNYLNLPTSQFSYTDSYNGGTNYIAKVQPFGVGTDTSSQKSVFWNWVSAATANGGTPLRQALDAVGQYYKTDQPWQTSSADTTELACRQSYTILTTDGFWNERDSDIGSTVGNMDNSTKGPITGPNSQPYTYNPVAPYSDGNSNTLADVAMKYWVTDLRSAPNEVPTNKGDPAFWQHMTTFTLGLGFTPQNISPAGTTIQQISDWANGGAAIDNFSWPTPAANSINNIADLAHAAINSHGGFYSATSPQSFANGLKDALKRASDRVGTGASLAANSTQLKTGAFAYQANYYTGNWKGDLKAIAVDPNNGTLALTPTWTAASALPAFGSRNIYTYNPTVSPVAAVAFKTTTGLSSPELAALGGDAATQQDMISYLRGDASKEKSTTGGIYRTRETPLGDIVDSQPVYVGQPDANQFNGQSFTGTDTFDAYAATTRQGLIFVAANDGMLHAFDAGTVAVPAGTGAEVYAYLPAAVITTNTSTTGRTTGDLTTLANPDYGTTTAVPHQFFNDGELTVGDVYFGSAWHTVAVGTTGRGLAKAAYALDVTDPSNIKLLWERSAGDGKINADYIGQMTGKPVIAQTNDAGTADPTGNGNWSVLIGNGYNSKNGTAALLQFAISDGTLNVHITDSTTGNGLAAPAVWMDDLSSGISTVAYAGDAKGRVWSFQLNKLVKSGNTYTPTPTPTSPGAKLFTALDSSNTVQPITAGMLVGKNPVTQDLWLFFGTGQYLSSSDLATRTTQSWYGLIVQSSASSGSTAVSSSTTRTALKQRSIIAETPGTPEVLNADSTVKTPAIAPARAVTAASATTPDPDMVGKSGWYIDLLSPTSSTDSTTGNVTYTPNQTAQGERIVTPNQFQGNQLLATTRIPQATDLCNPSGRGWIMAVDPFTGTNPKLSFFDLNGDGLINQPADYIMVGGKPVATSGMGFNSLPNNPIFMGGSMLVSFDNGSATSIKTSGTSGTLQRVSWRELIAQ